MERVVQGLLFIILSWHLRLERGKSSAGTAQFAKSCHDLREICHLSFLNIM